MTAQVVSHPTQSASIHDQSLFSTIGLVCDIRIGILLAGELGLLTSRSSTAPTIILLMGAGMSWIPMWLVRKNPGLLIRKWAFPCADLVITIVIIIALPTLFNDAIYLSLAYVLASALLTGLITTTTWATIWAAGAIVLTLTRSKIGRAHV